LTGKSFIFISLGGNGGWLRGKDLNLRPLGYEPNELPDCSTPLNHPTVPPPDRQDTGFGPQFCTRNERRGHQMVKNGSTSGARQVGTATLLAPGKRRGISTWRRGTEMGVYDVKRRQSERCCDSRRGAWLGALPVREEARHDGLISFVEHPIMGDFSAKNTGNVTFSEFARHDFRRSRW
jgi:hypothetical protein